MIIITYDPLFDKVNTTAIQGYVNELQNKFTDIGAAGAENNQIAVLQASDLVKIGDSNALRVGLEYRDNRAWGEIYGGAGGYQDIAGSVMWSWQITPQLALTNSARLDRLALNRVDALSQPNTYMISQYQNAVITAPSEIPAWSINRPILTRSACYSAAACRRQAS